VVQAWTPEPAKQVVERVLHSMAKRWQLDEVAPAKNGKTAIKYVVRLDRETPAESLVRAVIDQGAPNLLSAALV
jgi:hypothetical protein